MKSTIFYLIAKFYYFQIWIIQQIKKGVLRLELIDEIICLGFTGKAFADQIDYLYYEQKIHYSQRQYNLKGLFDWEQAVIASYFKQCKTLLVAGAGGGREVISLSKMGFKVDAFECNDKLVKFGNELLYEEDVSSYIHTVPRDNSLVNKHIYDGVILGWGMYMLINGKSRRIEFLRNIRRKVGSNAPVLLSFFTRMETTHRFKKIITYANRIRTLFRMPKLDIGDRLSPNLVHFFTENELKEEIEAAGFKLSFYQVAPYGHAVAHAV